VKVAAAIDTPVKAILNGEVIYERTVSVGGGENLVVVVEKKESSEAGPAVAAPADTATQPPEENETGPAAPADGEKKKKDPLWISGWVLLGVGVAAAGGGVATGAMALSTNKELLDCAEAGNTCDAGASDLNDRQKTLSILSTALIIGGGAIAATGITLLIVSKVKGRKDSNSAVTFTPAATGTAVGAVLTGRF
jgi:hypothetical protein